MTWPKVTRFEVIDETGRVYNRTGIHAELQLQDDGRTLKVYISELPPDEAAAARAVHRQELAADLIALNQRKGRTHGTAVRRDNRDHDGKDLPASVSR